MRLSTLWKVDREITGDGRNPIAEEIARRWSHAPASARFFRSSANFVYTLGTERRYFLRFAGESERSQDLIEAELRLLRSLAQLGAPVAVPAPSRWSALDQLPVTTGNYGIVHGDFELDNIWNGEVTGIVDFDECSRDWHAADIAYALRDLFVHVPDLADERLKAFLSGYRRHSELDEASFAALPTFVSVADLVQYARLARALDLRDDRNHPEWLTRLEGKLKARLARYLASLTSS